MAVIMYNKNDERYIYQLAAHKIQSENHPELSKMQMYHFKWNIRLVRYTTHMHVTLQ